MPQASRSLSTLASLMTFTAAASIVSVELGGDAVLPCHGSVSTCRLTPVAGPTAMASGKPVVSHAHPINTTHCICKMPPMDAAVPVNVDFAEGEAFHSKSGSAGRIDYVALWMPSLSRRPYITSDTRGAVLLKSHVVLQGAEISIMGSDGRVVLAPVRIHPGVAEEIPFSLSSFAAQTVEKLTLTVSCSGFAPLPSRTLLFERVALPQVPLFSQVDYSRKALLVNGAPFVAQGFYDARPMVNQSQIDSLLLDYEIQQGLGFNVVMQYGTDARWTPADSDILYLLNGLHAKGLFIMFNIVHVVQNLTGQGNTTAIWNSIKQRIDLVKNHPALLGWYICDDCMSSYLSRQLKSNTSTVELVYRALRQYDPWHITIGASESEDLYVFTQPNIFVPGPSLDVTMVENYVGTLAANAALGGTASPGNDGGLRRWPMTWEPVINCIGNYVVKHRRELCDEDQAAIVYSLLWLSVVTADMPAQLTFRRSYADDVQMNAIGRYNKLVSRFQQFFIQPPSGLPEATAVAWASPSAPGTCKQCARLWRLQQQHFCALLVVVNTQEESVTATVQLSGVQGMWPVDNATIEPIDPPGHVVSAVEGRFSTIMQANATNIYHVGCQTTQLMV